MNPVIKKAKLNWLTPEQGGRTKPPLGLGEPSYATVMRFLDEPWPPVGIAWSLVVEKIEAASTEYEWIANVYYLMLAAPQDSLISGRKFELYEGNRCVATGVILSDDES